MVGWDSEPAFQNQLNAASFRITTKDGDKPVEGLDKTLKASIAFGGGQPKEFPLEAVFGQPGLYVAHVMRSARDPARSGFSRFPSSSAHLGTRLQRSVPPGTTGAASAARRFRSRENP